MKKILFSVLGLALLMAAPGCNSDNKEAVTADVVTTDARPEMEWMETEHDFGAIHEGEIVSHAFQFKNTGEGMLVINGVSTSCGCTAPSYSKDPVPPGETGFIEVRFNSLGKPGENVKTITVTDNTEKGKHELTIKAQVEPDK